EFGHAIEFALFDGNVVAESTEFNELFMEEKEQIFPGDDYMDYAEEYFAETIAYFYLDDIHAEELLQKAPKTYAFIEKLDTLVLAIDGVTDQGVSLAWTPLEKNLTYEIERDGV